MNRSILIGRPTKDIVIKVTTNGTKIASFTLASNRLFKQNGKQEADFIQCIAFNKTADSLEKYVAKGDLIGVEGRIQTRNYEDQTGKKIYITEVVIETVQFLESKQRDSQVPIPSETSTLIINDEDLPFF